MFQFGRRQRSRHSAVVGSPPTNTIEQSILLATNAVDREGRSDKEIEKEGSGSTAAFVVISAVPPRMPDMMSKNRVRGDVMVSPYRRSTVTGSESLHSLQSQSRPSSTMEGTGYWEPNLDTRLWMTAAGVGDCEVVVGEPERQSCSLLPKHDMQNESEVERLEACQPPALWPNPEQKPRVRNSTLNNLFDSVEDLEHDTKEVVNQQIAIPGTRFGRLYCTRAFGDYGFKSDAKIVGQPKKLLAQDYVSACPALFSIELVGTESAVDVVILGSDGLWDKYTPARATDFVRDALCKSVPLDKICDELVSGQNDDNTTAIIILIDSQ